MERGERAMSVRSFTLSVLAVLWLCSATAFAQVEPWQSHMVAGVQAYQQGNYPEAEKQFTAAVKEAEHFGPEDPRLATSLNNLALLYYIQGKYAEAEPLHKRALAIYEKTLGPEHPDVAAPLHSLAGLYYEQGKYAEAEPLYKRALAIREKALGPEHPDVAGSLNDLAGLYQAQGRYAEAEPRYKRALAIEEKALGPGHSLVATSLNNLAALYWTQGKYAEAEPLNKRALAIQEKALGPEHPDVATSLNNLAVLYKAQGKYAEALVHIRRASAIHRGRAERTGGARSTGALKEQASVRVIFLRHVELAALAIGRKPEGRARLLAEAFEAGQLARVSGTSGAVARMAARFAAGDDALARTVRARQDAVERWRLLDARLVKAASQPPGKRNAAVEGRLRSNLKALDARLGELDGRLAREFPEYAELAAPRPVALADARKLLAPDEALLAYAIGETESYLWAVRADRAKMVRVDLGRAALDRAVAELRNRLMPRVETRPESPPPFNLTRAHELYRKLFAPAEPMLEGVRHVFVVPDAGLQSLPLGVLVTEAPQERFTDLPGYRRAPWLAKKYAMTVLPSVSSLRALRSFARATRAKLPFVGFGDPALEGKPGGARGIELAALFPRGAVADVVAVRNLPPLPDTADELRAIARALKASDDEIYLGARATEGRLKTMDLSRYRVLAFATHGLVGEDIKGLAEPGLVLTPPEEGSERDDGILTASEVAKLKLDAEWVILSACNTAAADGTPGAEGLSGLAKAFFYAGSRALLVSHWPVVSDAAVKLTTGAFAELAKPPGIGRAEAMRRSMLALMADEERPFYAHPMFWAPFIVVGEGGRQRQ
ncbi:MAG: CHAT domain-containing protein [Proteobacteria bacterium]|nr:CHAT domain-containing protein [Pseudomonadota bacterium]